MTDYTTMALIVAGAAAVAVIGWWMFSGHAQGAARTAGGRLGRDEIARLLAGQGYQVGDIDFDDGRYEVEARDASGAKVELEVDAVTGRILKVERD